MKLIICTARRTFTSESAAKVKTTKVVTSSPLKSLEDYQMAEVKPSKSSSVFDTFDQEDEFFGVFDKIRGKSVGVDKQDKLMAELIVLEPVHDIETSGGDGSMVCYKHPDGGMYVVHFSAGGEETQIEKLKVKTPAELKVVLKKAEKAADKA